MRMAADAKSCNASGRSTTSGMSDHDVLDEVSTV